MPDGTSVYAYLQNEDAPNRSLSYPLESNEKRGSQESALSSPPLISRRVPVSRPPASIMHSATDPEPVVLLDSDSNGATQHSDVASISSDSDVELLPLAQRIGLISKHKPPSTTVSKQKPAATQHTLAGSSSTCVC